MNCYDYLVKCVVVGDSGTGKSCIMVRFADDVFNYSYISTIGVDFKINTIEYKNKIVKFQIWDTAGQDRFRTITSSYYRGSQGTLICYDITDRQTFNNISKWLGEVKKFSINEPILILCGTKNDLESNRQVSYEEGQQFAKANGMEFFESSSKNNFQIREIFECIADKIILDKLKSENSISESYQNYELRKGRNVVSLSNNDSVKPSTCC